MLNCLKEISEMEINQFIDERNNRKINESKNITKFTELKEFSTCPTFDCKFLFIYGKYVKTNQFECPFCKHLYCLDCKVEFHKGLSCREFKKFKLIENPSFNFALFNKGQKFKQCNICKTWIELIISTSEIICKCGNKIQFDKPGTSM